MIRMDIVFVWIIVILCTKVSSSGVFEVSILALNNNRGITQNGRCCSGTRTTPPCTTQCSTFFSVCLLHYIYPLPRYRPCTFGTASSQIFAGNNIYSADKNDIVLKIPLNFSWPGKFSLILEVWHAIDGNKTQTDITQLIIRSTVQGKLMPSDHRKSEHVVSPTTELSFKYGVYCDVHYYGRTCKTFCRPRDDQLGHFKCTDEGIKKCSPGWEGHMCNKAVCPSKCISAGGFCERPYQCRCRLGWFGEHCERCQRHSGCLHGFCHVPHQCICQDGWAGPLCDIDRNFCQRSNPCLNGGACVPRDDVIGNYTCTCGTGFVGINCEIPTCYDDFCENGGTCMMNNYRQRHCECRTGTYGDRCQHFYSGCDVAACDNGGTCLISKHGSECHCTKRYTGKFCEERVDACRPMPCRNGGMCKTSGRRYKCECAEGYGGKNCEKRSNPCSRVRCLNGGYCQMDRRTRRAVCTCLGGYDGHQCEHKVERHPCDGVTCLHGSTCMVSEMQNGFVCHCRGGYTGEMCETKINYCESLPCQNGGQCKSYSTSYLCICTSEYSGINCETSMMPADQTLHANLTIRPIDVDVIILTRDVSSDSGCLKLSATAIFVLLLSIFVIVNQT